MRVFITERMRNWNERLFYVYVATRNSSRGGLYNHYRRVLLMDRLSLDVNSLMAPDNGGDCWKRHVRSAYYEQSHSTRALCAFTINETIRYCNP